MQAGVWPGRMHRGGRDRPELEPPVREQMVELAAVALELGAGIEDLAEHVLDHSDALADASLPPTFALT